MCGYSYISTGQGWSGHPEFVSPRWSQAGECEEGGGGAEILPWKAQEPGDQNNPGPTLPTIRARLICCMTLSKLSSILEPQLPPLVTASPGGCVQKSSFTQHVLLRRARERSTLLTEPAVSPGSSKQVTSVHSSRSGSWDGQEGLFLKESALRPGWSLPGKGHSSLCQGLEAGTR